MPEDFHHIFQFSGMNISNTCERSDYANEVSHPAMPQIRIHCLLLRCALWMLSTSSHNADDPQHHTLQAMVLCPTLICIDDNSDILSTFWCLASFEDELVVVKASSQISGLPSKMFVPAHRRRLQVHLY